MNDVIQVGVRGSITLWHNVKDPVLGRDGGNDFRFSDIALRTGRFSLILVRISSVVYFRVDIRQLSLFLICGLLKQIEDIRIKL